MRVLNKVVALLCLAPVLVVAEPLDLGDIDALAVGKELRDADGIPLSVIQAREVKTEEGIFIHGPQEAVVTVATEAEFGITVGGRSIAPGETGAVSFFVASDDGSFQLTIAPTVGGVVGESEFVVHIPQLQSDRSLAQWVCATGQLVADNQCEQANVVPYVLSCQEEYALSQEGTICERTVRQSASYGCPAGYYTSGGSCKRTSYSPATRQCSGWVVGGQCLMSQRGADCPANTFMSMEGCEATVAIYISVTQSCPTNAPYDHGPSHTDRNKRFCTNARQWISDPNCSSGELLHENSCFSNETPFTYSCSSGDYSPSRGECVTTTTTSKRYSCQAGWTLSGSTCSQVHYEAAVASHCPSGSVELDEKCMEYSYLAAQPQCEPGNSFDESLQLCIPDR